MASVFRNGQLFCTNCGGSHKLSYPMPVGEMDGKVKAFDKLHKKCKPTWTEPKADMTKTAKERAEWWIEEGERGMSSEVIWHCMMNKPHNRITHPSDPDDFKRCYKLLQAVPEWRLQLHKLKSISVAWSNLVDNWDKLTEMFEQNQREEWKNHKEIGMYDLMEKLTSNGK